MAKKFVHFSFVILISICAVVPGIAQVDWTPSTKHGNIDMTGPSQSAIDINITRNTNGAIGGIILNSHAAGRSIMMLGEGFGGRYGYLAHHGASHVSDPGYTQTYRSESTVLTGSGNGGLGIVAKSEIRFNSGGEGDGNLRMVLNAAGNLGVGVANPVFKLEMPVNSKLAIGSYGKTFVDNTIDDSNSYTRSSFGSCVNWDATGNVWNVTGIGNNDFSAMIHPNGDGLAFIAAPGDGNYSKSLTNEQFYGFERMRITASGKVGIGTRYPDAALTVKGNIHTQEVKVDLLGAVAPDYVFEADYPLTSLEELKSYIDQNKHLPEIPSAKEMEEEGINLKEMNLLLLKKVEELTLHLIDQEEINRKQQNLLEKQGEELNNLKAKLQTDEN